MSTKDSEIVNKTEKPKILLPKVDVIFKLLFGDTRNIEILKGFLKSVLQIADDEFETLTIVDPILKKENLMDKYGIVDVRITTKSGMIVHVEMQLLDIKEMPERTVYYNSKMLVSQLKTGESYDKLHKTISIIIVDFDFVQDNSSQYHHLFQLYDKPSGTRFSDLVEIHTLELKKLPKDTDDTDVYDWMSFLRAEQEEEFEMVAEKNPTIKQAYVELKRLSQDEENQLIFEARQKAILDEDARIRTAEFKGELKGELKGKLEDVVSMIKELKIPLSKAMEVVKLNSNEYKSKLILELDSLKIDYTE